VINLTAADAIRLSEAAQANKAKKANAIEAARAANVVALVKGNIEASARAGLREVLTSLLGFERMTSSERALVIKQLRGDGFNVLRSSPTCVVVGW
jgi:tellurite resistance protein